MRIQSPSGDRPLVLITCATWLLLCLVTSQVHGQAVLAPEPLAADPQTAQEATAELTDQAASLARLTEDIQYLASEKLAGRQPGTPEMQLSEDFIIEQYQQAGLGSVGSDGFRQFVAVDGTRTIDADATRLSLLGPDEQQLDLALGESFTPLIGRKPNSADTELVFVGYGISAPEHNYDEYRSVDVKGKVVVMLRREPQQTSPTSVFDGQDTSDHSFITSKVRAAKRAGAAGIILVNDAETAPDADSDQLVQPSQFGTISFPFYQIKRATVNQLLAASPLRTPLGKKLKSLQQVEAWIDERLEPISQSIRGWAIKASASFLKTEIKTANLVGVLEGQGELADQTVIVGAHYDHLGRGAYGSRTPWRKEIHFGADDNATGTAAVLELARRFAARPGDDRPRRRLVFICFTAEEMGLLGALHYVAEPLFELDDTVAMVNFDMIGLLRKNQLTIYNWNTSPAFASVLTKANEPLGLELIQPSAGFAGSDHLPFNQSKIPNMFIHTGISDTYHTPDDTFETINCDGVLTVVDYSQEVLEQLLTGPRPVYGKPKPFRLGLQLDREGSESGVGITKVVPDSVAEKAGIQVGDSVVSVDGDLIKKRRDLVRRIRRDAGKTITLKVKRADQDIDFEIELKD